MISTSTGCTNTPPIHTPVRLRLLLVSLSLLVANVSVGRAFFVVAPSPPGLLAGHRSNVLLPRTVQANSLLRQTAAGGGLASATEGARAAAATGGPGGNRDSGMSRRNSRSSGGSSSRSSSSGSSSDDDIDLGTAMTNARANLAEGRSPGAGLESAFDQADAAFADLIVTSVDDQGVTLDDQDVEELAKGGMMDDESKTKKSKGLFGDMSDVFGALSGGAHIVKREDGTL